MQSITCTLHGLSHARFVSHPCPASPPASFLAFSSTCVFLRPRRIHACFDCSRCTFRAAAPRVSQRRRFEIVLVKTVGRIGALRSKPTRLLPSRSSHRIESSSNRTRWERRDPNGRDRRNTCDIRGVLRLSDGTCGKRRAMCVGSSPRGFPHLHREEGAAPALLERWSMNDCAGIGKVFEASQCPSRRSYEASNATHPL